MKIISKQFSIILLLFFISASGMSQVIEEEPPPPPREAAPPPPPPPPPPPAREAEIFKIVEEMPRFPGCEDISDKGDRKACSQEKMVEYIYRNLRYPKIAKENGVEGTTVIRFIIRRDGTIDDPKILKDVGAGCGAEALRVVNSMNNMPERWIPGKQRGRPVDVSFNMPVKFSAKQFEKYQNSKIAPQEVEMEKEPTGIRDQERMAPPPPPPPPPESKEDLNYKVVEEMPRFPGCEDVEDMEERRKCAQKKMLMFIYSNIKYPPLARENSVEGTVVVQYIIQKDGTIRDAKILQDIGAECGTEALRVVNMMNEMPERWIPGVQRGKAVAVQYNLPIKFKLESRKKKKKKRKKNKN